MKKNYILLFSFLVFSSVLLSQNSAKKYVLVEHFTNTRCPICASRNPSLFEVIDDHPNDVHHISYHPPIPYNSCIFYLADPDGNQARSTYYDVNGTPTAMLLGKTPPGSSLLDRSALEMELNQTSPVQIIIDETGTTDRNVSIEVNILSDLPTGNYTFYAMIVEKSVDYDAPNGEQVHHNVFRKALAGNDGDPFSPPAAGNSKTYNYSFTVDNDWASDETYVLAFIQNDDTKAILNSGTKFDSNTTGLNTLGQTKILTLSPNPVQDQLYLDFGQTLKTNAMLKIYDIQGKLLSAQKVRTGLQQTQINVANLPAGVLFVQIENEAGLWSGKVLK